MAGKSPAVKREIAPSWKAFMEEVIPFGTASAATAAVVGESPTGTWAAKSSSASILRRQLSGKVGQPTPESVWCTAETARQIPGREWCAGALFLFAAGHFERYAHMMLVANQSGLITNERFRTLVTSTSTACTRSVLKGEVEFTCEQRAKGIPDTLIQKALRRRRARNDLPIRPDRNSWILTDDEELALEKEFRFPAYTDHTAIVTARLADLHPEIGIGHQREMVLTALRGLVT
jgi:hypothetical protein